MSLQSSGAISLSQTQSEWGGSSPISLSEYYRGSLPSGRTNYGTIPYSGAIDMADFYGSNAASAAWTATITVGTYNLFKTTYYGYNSIFSAGSITDTTIDTYSNRTLSYFNWASSNVLLLQITGAPNSGWTTIKIGSTSFNRTAAATFDSTNSIWTWSTTTNPFGTSGNKTIQFII